MRIRQIKPAYWADALVQKELTADQREFYVGLWMQADDAGWLRLDIAEIAAELYRYEGVKRREQRVQRWADRLRELGRLEVPGCGHALIPTLVRHQRLAGATKRVYTIQSEHDEQCGGRPADPRGFPRLPDGKGIRVGPERKLEPGRERVESLGRSKEWHTNIDQMPPPTGPSTGPGEDSDDRRHDQAEIATGPIAGSLQATDPRSVLDVLVESGLNSELASNFKGRRAR